MNSLGPKLTVGLTMVMVMGGWRGAGGADYTDLLTEEQSGFEQAAVNDTPRTSQGTNPAGWAIVNENSDPGSLSNICVEDAGSPFTKDSRKSMLIFKSQSGTKQLKAEIGLSPNHGGAFQFGFDFRLNSATLSSQDGKLLFGVQCDGKPDVYTIVAINAPDNAHYLQSNNGSNPSIKLNNRRWEQFEPNTWYRIIGTVKRVGTIPNHEGENKGTLTGLLGSFQIWRWDSETQSPVQMAAINPNTPEGDNIFMLWPDVSAMPARIDGVCFLAGYSNNKGRMDFNIDNVFIRVPRSQVGDSKQTSEKPDDAKQ